MAAARSPAELREIDAARELQIASKRADGTLRQWVPVWVVSTGGLVYVRTWYRRNTGWFGQVLASRRARIRVPGLEADVAVEDVGEGTPELHAGVSAAYETKYGPGGGTAQMVSAEAAAATLRLNPVDRAQAAAVEQPGRVPVAGELRPLHLPRPRPHI
jgi:hypothetical protein